MAGQVQHRDGDHPSALVIGAGVFGAATALALARRGWRVTIIERATPGHAGASSGGESRLLRFSHGGDRTYTELAWTARQGWRALEEDSGRTLLVETGLVWFARRAGGWEDDSLATCAAAGVPVERLAPERVVDLYPSVRTDDLAFGVWEPHGGVLRARHAVAALVAVAQRHGARLRDGTAARPERGGVRAGDEVLHADRVIWACGPWLPALFPDAVALTVTQQDTCFFTVEPAWRAGRVPAWVDFDGAAYGTGDLDGHGFKCSSDAAGPPFDPERDDRLPLAEHVAAARALLAHRFPGLAAAPLAGTRTCQYTTTRDTRFAVVPLDGGRAWLLGGGSGHGFKHGPALGAYMADLVDGSRTPDARLAGGPRAAAAGSLRTSGHATR